MRTLKFIGIIAAAIVVRPIFAVIDWCGDGIDLAVTTWRELGKP